MRTRRQGVTGAGLGPSGALCVIVLIFLFQTLLENYFYKASYIDEAIAALFFGYFVLEVLVSAEIRAEDLFLCFLMLMMTLSGLYGNIHLGIQKSTSAIIIDIVSHIKFVALILGVSAFCRVNRVDYRSVIKLPVLLGKVYLLVLLFFAMLNLLKDIGMHAEYRYGIRVFSFIFGTPGIVTNLVLFIIMLLLMERALDPSKKNLFFLAVAELLLILVIKSRSLILAAFFLMLYESLVIETKKSMVTRAGLIGIVAVIIGFPQFLKYFVNGEKANLGTAPRLLFLQGGIQLFKQYFPFGSGFGTFGSSTAATHYSDLYYMMGFDKVAGMSPENPVYLNDTFWGMIFGQLGFLGTVFYALMLGGALWILYQRARKTSNRYIRLAALFYAANALMSSIQSNYPGNNSMVMLTFLVTMMPYAAAPAEQEKSVAVRREILNGY